VFLLILESLGSTELLFILVMALVFFGPRKLPQISRTLGKNIADFKRASEDFKRTWEKEVRIEETSTAMAASAPASVAEPSMGDSTMENSILGGPDTENAGDPVQQPSIQAIAPDRVVARQSLWPNAPESSDNTNPASAQVEPGTATDKLTDEIQPSTKRDWL
jgi:Tat protein translocase TatB subunit